MLETALAILFERLDLPVGHENLVRPAIGRDDDATSPHHHALWDLRTARLA